MNTLIKISNNIKTGLQLDRDRHVALKVLVAIGLIVFIVAKPLKSTNALFSIIRFLPILVKAGKLIVVVLLSIM